MTVSRRRFLAASGAAIAAPAIARPASAQAQVTLRLHHFLPPISNGHAKMLAPWAKMVEQDSGGKIKIVLPFIAADIVRIGLLIAFPGLALWLVRLLS